MRMLAWVLGLVAVLGSCPLGVNWIAARDGLRAATVASAKARDDVRDSQASVRLEEMMRESDADTIRFAVRNDELAIEMARLQGQSVEDAEKRLNADQMKQTELQAGVRAQQVRDSEGEDERIVAAKKRLEEARSSASIYRGWLAVDEKLAYALGVVWLSFGLSVALSAKDK